MKPNIQDDKNARRYSLPLLAVIFDVDAALADTERNGQRIAFNRAFQEFDLSLHWTTESYGELLATVAGGKERIRHFEISHPINVPNGGPSTTGLIDCTNAKAKSIQKL